MPIALLLAAEWPAATQAVSGGVNRPGTATQTSVARL